MVTYVSHFVALGKNCVPKYKMGIRHHKFLGLWALNFRKRTLMLDLAWFGRTIEELNLFSLSGL